MTRFEKELDAIDASVFSSDMLFDKERREIFEKYVSRWSRALSESAPSDEEEIECKCPTVGPTYCPKHAP